MDIIDKLRELSARAEKLVSQLDTEEATKNGLIMPFINALGYNVFDPTEVIPEFTADVGVKKGEKVDYAILRDGTPIMLFECKAAGINLDKEHASQLYRYFSVTPARFGVLTNGIVYRVFSDLESPNKMDSRPFLEFSILEVSEELADQLKKFAKQSFDLGLILSTASDLKYRKGIKRSLMEEWTNPTEDFVKLFASRVYEGRLTQNTKEQFTDIVKRAFQSFVSDRINERLKSALSSEGDSNSPASPDTHEETEGQIVTTEDEIEGFYIVKSIVREVIDAQRVFMRDTLSYCGVLLDDNNRRPLCRLYFNSSQKYLGTFDKEKKITRHAINDVNEIYNFAEQLKLTARQHDDPKSGKSDSPTQAE